MFGGDLSAGSLNGLGDRGGEGDGNGGGVGISGIAESVVESTITEILCVSFSISFTFDNMSDKSSMSISPNVGAVFVDNLFASLLVGDLFADNIGGRADVFGSGCTRLDFNFLS